MKIFKTLLIPMLMVSSLFCVGNDMVAAPEGCTIPPELTIKNVSGYKINEIYMHDDFDYSGSTPIAADVLQDAEIPVSVYNGMVQYFTFIRNITSTSAFEIAVTTSTPIEFSYCYEYTLNLLSEDFFLQEEVNPDAYRSDDPGNTDIK